MQKKCNIVLCFYNMQNKQVFAQQKLAHDQQKQHDQSKMTDYAEKMQYRHPPPRLLTSNIIQYVCTCIHIM